MSSTPTRLRAHRSARPAASLASMWREIQGSHNWQGLLDPLNPVLRDEIVRYGELVAACYEAFDVDPQSPRYLSCKYGRASLLCHAAATAGPLDPAYNVTKYLYTAPDVPAAPTVARWVGYVAVSSDAESRRLGRRDILVAFRGTVTRAEWLANLMSALTPARLDPVNPRMDVQVESGFLSLYTSPDRTNRFATDSCRDQVLRELSRLIKEHDGEETSITLAGHSMGSSLAILLGYDLAELGINLQAGRVLPVTVYSFGGPRVGNPQFKMRCDELGVKVLRVANAGDPVTRLPAGFMAMGGKNSCYVHVGVELALDLFKVQNLACVHDLVTYLKLLKFSNMAVNGDEEREREEGLLEKAMEMVRSNVGMFDAWPWQDAARQVGSLVQSLGF